MIKKQPGEIFEYENFRYSIGDWMRCSEESDYAGLSGIILEIRDGEDRETDNPTPDIYCRLQIPQDTRIIQKLEEKFSKLYGKSVKITDIPLERIILSPYELGSIIGVPNCYTPETNTPYPLCIGNGSACVKDAPFMPVWITTNISRRNLMKFTVNRLLMYQAVKTVLKVVRPRREIPEIGGLLVEADGSKGILTITGTDVRTHIQRRLRLEHIEESGSIILPPILAEMLYLLADEFVELESERNLVTLRSGACQYTISGLAAKSFPKLQIPFPEDTIQVKGINSLIRRTVFAANGDNIDYNRAGFSYVKISFRGGMATAEATDGSRMAVTASPHCADGDLDMILHEKALTVLDSIVKPDEELYVGIVGQVAFFMKEDLFFSTMLFTGNYLEASKLLSNFHGSYQATIDAKQLYELVCGLSAIFDTRDDKCINLRIEPDGVCARLLPADAHRLPK